MRLLLSLLIVLAVPAAALAAARENPADALVDIPIEASVYDPATHCSSKARPGVVKLRRWLEENSRGVFWGSYRCEKWGRHEASLHAENRAIDWHLDASVAADRRAAGRLIDLLLATDSVGRDHVHIGMTKAGAAGRTSFWRSHTG